MNEPEGSKFGAIAVIVAIPVMIACCAAPLLMFGLAASAVSWFSGFGTLETIAVLSVVAAGVFSFNRFKRSQTQSSKVEKAHE